MQTIKKIATIALMLIATVTYSQQKTTLKGKIKKGRGKMIYLKHNQGNKVTYVDSAKINFFGRFKMETDVVLDDFYQIAIEKKMPYMLVLKRGEKVKIKAPVNFNNKEYKVTGSPDSKLIQEYNEVKYSNKLSKDSLSNFALDFIQKNSKSLAIFVALNDVKDIKKALTLAENGIGQSYANSNYHKSLQSGLQQVEKSEQAKKASKTRVGAVAPELNMVNPDGKIVTLQSLRGKYVLIDFWASWCGPCRRENPTVVRLYNKYKNQGFDVYSVSLDKSKSKWVSAIAKDKLSWPNHVSDLKGWGSAATRLYGFRGIPYTVLIDKEGKIIGTRLRGPALERKLEELFK